MSARALIFHKNIPGDTCAIFLLVLNLIALTFDTFYKKIDISYN